MKKIKVLFILMAVMCIPFLGLADGCHWHSEWDDPGSTYSSYCVNEYANTSVDCSPCGSSTTTTINTEDDC